MNSPLDYREAGSILVDAHPVAQEPHTSTVRLSLSDFAKVHVNNDWYTWAMDNYKKTLIALTESYQCNSLLEVGGGRSPLLSEAEVEALGVRYTANDISESELNLCPAWPEKACFDIAGDNVPTGTYDLVFSRMVMEHVRSAETAYRNIYFLLRYGGIGFHFHPTLFAPPFVFNSLAPTGLSQKILAFLFASRVNDASDAYPKFPAYYSWCRSTAGITRKIRKVGFREVFIFPFYGHGYLRNIPLLNMVDDSLSDLARVTGFRPYSSYAYVMVRR